MVLIRLSERRHDRHQRQIGSLQGQRLQFQSWRLNRYAQLAIDMKRPQISIFKLHVYIYN